jgi:hypothetical protein
MSSLNESTSDRHFMGYSDQCLLRDVFSDPADFKHNRAGSDSGHPKRRLTFALAHSRFQRLGTYGLVWEYPKIDLTFPMQEMGRSDPPGFNLSGVYPAPFQRLQTVFTKGYKIAPCGIALHPAALALTVLYSLWHHCHSF